MEALKYALVGDGRLATHLKFYLTHLGHTVQTWTRAAGNTDSLRALAASCDVILLAIQDSAIDGVAKVLDQDLQTQSRPRVHFSGSLVSSLALGCHPLMTFSQTLYDQDFYPRIPFTVEEGVDFAQLFPRLTNPVFSMRRSDRAYYHALCVMAGNFTTLLWQNVGQKFEKDLQLSANILGPYLEKITEQLRTSPATALSGPFARKDYATVERNISALARSPGLQHIYQGFRESFLSESASQEN